jgi:hypothetical protein
MSTTNLTDTLVNSPITGTIVTGSSLVASHLIPFIDKGHLNPIIIEVLQAGGYCTTIVVGMFTIYGYIKKLRHGK